MTGVYIYRHSPSTAAASLQLTSAITAMTVHKLHVHAFLAYLRALECGARVLKVTGIMLTQDSLEIDRLENKTYQYLVVIGSGGFIT